MCYSIERLKIQKAAAECRSDIKEWRAREINRLIAVEMERHAFWNRWIPFFRQESLSRQEALERIKAKPGPLNAYDIVQMTGGRSEAASIRILKVCQNNKTEVITVDKDDLACVSDFL